MSRVTTRIPATSANLGPGYDAFGLALGLHNTFSAELAEEWHVQVVGEGADELRSDGTNRVARSMARAFEALGVSGYAANVVSENRIPPGRGLGSSAAAIVGGLVLGNELAGGRLSCDEILELAIEAEGHPDNVGAALLGGLTISAQGEHSVNVHRVPIGAGLAAVVVVSRLPFKTKRARNLLPAQVPHDDAAFNAGHAGLLASGLALGRADLIGEGLSDRIHEQYRAEAIPGFFEVKAALVDAGAVGAALSGAGPTVIGLVTGEDDAAALATARDVADRAAPAVAAAERFRTPIALAVEREAPTVL